MNRITPKSLSNAARLAALMFLFTAVFGLAVSGDAWAKTRKPHFAPLVVTPTIIDVDTCGNTDNTPSGFNQSNLLYNVTADLTASSGDCIDLNGSNDGLLLNGHTITCSPGPCNNGIDVGGSQDLTIGFEAIIMGFKTGFLNGGSQDNGDGLLFESNGIGLHLQGSQNNYVAMNACGSMVVTGLTNSGTGIWIDGGSNNYISSFLAGFPTADICAANAKDGVLITGANTSGANIFAAVGNGGNGVHLGGTSNPSGNNNVKVFDAFSADTIDDNAQNGVFLDTSEANAQDQIAVVQSMGNSNGNGTTFFDLRDATAGCGKNYWYADRYSTSEDGSTHPSTCIQPSI